MKKEKEKGKKTVKEMKIRICIQNLWINRGERKRGKTGVTVSLVNIRG